MRHVALALLAATALSTGTAQIAFAAPAPPVYNWTGFYIGGYAGYGWGRTTARDVGNNNGLPWYILGTEFSAKPNSFIGGAQTGYNFQFNQFVLGMEADVGYFRLNGSALYDNTPAHSDTSVVSSGTYAATVRGRFGYAFDRTLVYVTGGGFFTNESVQVVSFSTFISPNTSMRSGWTLGGGLEYALSQNWSVKGEYLHYDLGNTTVTLAGTTSRFDIRSAGDLARVGFNYRFGGR